MLLQFIVHLTALLGTALILMLSSSFSFHATLLGTGLTLMLTSSVIFPRYAALLAALHNDLLRLVVHMFFTKLQLTAIHFSAPH
jgi:hypothetical protein